MKTKFFYPNKDGKIEFTEKELKQLLDEVYDEGYADGKATHITWQPPYHWEPYYTTATNTTVANNTQTNLTTDKTWSDGNPCLFD